MKLTVATCQFPISSDIRRNLRYVSRQIRAASDRGADVAHFPEACLSGYAGADFASYEDFNWTLGARRTLVRSSVERGIVIMVVQPSSNSAHSSP